MTRLQKLLARFHSGADLSFAELQSVFEAHGFKLDRISGSQHVYVHSKATRPISVQPDGKSAKRYQLKQLRTMIAEFSLAPDDE